jgi:hypothetical protein
MGHAIAWGLETTVLCALIVECIGLALLIHRALR